MDRCKFTKPKSNAFPTNTQDLWSISIVPQNSNDASKYHLQNIVNHYIITIYSVLDT